MRWCALPLTLALLLFVCRASLPSPLGDTNTLLYGYDCSQWCINGTQNLYPAVEGETNAYCSDPRRCYWFWRLSFVPCSLSLLSFDAEVGDAGVIYSQIDSTAARNLGVYCTYADGASQLQIRESDAPTNALPLMSWVYNSVDCLTLLSTLAAAPGSFVAGSTNVALEAQQWSGSTTASLQADEVECSDHSQTHALLPCEQCFLGRQLVNVPANATSDALALACGSTATSCLVSWNFCYNTCTQRTSRVTVKVGSGTLKQVAGVSLSFQAGEPDQRGRTLFALTDAASVQDIDQGKARFYLAWEYKRAPPAALFRAANRDNQFVALHFGMETSDGDTLLAPRQTSSAQAALGAYEWDGLQGTGIDVVVHAASSLTSKEKGLIAGIVVIGVLCVIGWLGFAWLALMAYWHRSHHHDDEHHHTPLMMSDRFATSSVVDSYLASGGTAASAAAAATTPTQQKTMSLDEAKRVVEESKTKKDLTYLYMDLKEQKLHDTRKAAELSEAQRLIDADYQARGGAATRIPGATTLIGAARALSDAARRDEDAFVGGQLI
jgi:hypothetical protein